MTNLDNLNLCLNQINALANKTKPYQHTTFNQAFYSILRASAVELDDLISKIDDLTACSLHTRNIFELYLILRHIYEDEEALNCWVGQSHKDSTDINKGFVTLFQSNGLDTSILENMQQLKDKALEESNYESKSPFQVRNLADKYGYLNDYLAVYKLCSKLIHPSSLKINLYNEISKENNYLKIVHKIVIHFSIKLTEFALNIENNSQY
ncbi:DUF5677 domain-containing protein [Shewanella sp. SG41-3]|uniref:DUF5677 domain-containing protein n=1 Tax=Shewanella sp. SG41-3 TaxID=2760977 RepID=UPI001600BD51|nr:DUF5677 domain-containing protein [Shewanella sp. SG41-3]MBB1475642.1 hypothetical protein [Shewanella sp. SG41-3]